MLTYSSGSMTCISVVCAFSNSAANGSLSFISICNHRFVKNRLGHVRHIHGRQRDPKQQRRAYDRRIINQHSYNKRYEGRDIQVKLVNGKPLAVQLLGERHLHFAVEVPIMATPNDEWQGFECFAQDNGGNPSEEKERTVEGYPARIREVIGDRDQGKTSYQASERNSCMLHEQFYFPAQAVAIGIREVSQP